MRQISEFFIFVLRQPINLNCKLAAREPCYKLCQNFHFAKLSYPLPHPIRFPRFCCFGKLSCSGLLNYLTSAWPAEHEPKKYAQSQKMPSSRVANRQVWPYRNGVEFGWAGVLNSTGVACHKTFYFQHKPRQSALFRSGSLWVSLKWIFEFSLPFELGVSTRHNGRATPETHLNTRSLRLAHENAAAEANENSAFIKTFKIQ